MAFSPRARVLLLAASILLGLATLVWYLSSKSRTTPVTPISAPDASGELPNPINNTGPGASPTPSIVPPADNALSPNASPNAGVSTSPPGTASPTPVSSEAHTINSASAELLIPVAGVKPEQLQDTYTQSRSEGRTHYAIDIMAARNTPVLAAADGQIIKLFNSERGGITLYQLGTDNRTIYYYAHLERYADGITENRFARRGEIIGYVGDSGNAGKDNCHLHFSIWLVTDPKRFWDGENVNPYPLLTKR
jgi:murein DD-endopeptidase MepM/ murein hydrolase activator NlpD